VTAGFGLVGAAIGIAAGPLIVRGAEHVSDLELGRSQVYLVIALSGALEGLVCARFAGRTVLAAYLPLVAGLVVLAIVDLGELRLPNRVMYPLFGTELGLLTLAAIGDHDRGALGRAALAAFVAGSTFLALHALAPRELGFGDVKLVVVLGLAVGWLGWSQLLAAALFAFGVGGLVGLALLVAGRKGRRDPLPFGPFLAAGALLAILAL
jgi:leader peptidase (prepilin peptidase) / N-methyltransferase